MRAGRRGQKYPAACSTVSFTKLTVSEAQWANSADWLSLSNAVSVSQRSAGVSGNCVAHCAWRASIAFAEAVSARPGACAEKTDCFAVISRQVLAALR